MGNEMLLEMKGIDKTFPEVHALKGVNFSVKSGQVHALMGENGAGKSTLIKILTGIYIKDSGTIIFDGREINPKTALDTQHEGISTIYQELNLVPFQTVYENIYVGREPRTKWKTVNRNEMIRCADEVLRSMGIHIDVTEPLHRYSTAIQQMVAIARAITTNAKLVIMDEPTSSLDTKEVQVLFTVIRRLVEKGIAVIFITHRLNEVFEIAEKITILKDGQLVGEFNAKDIDQLKLVSYMIGREAKELERKRFDYHFAEADELASMKNIRQGVRLNGIGIDIKKGEILGLAGLLGSGRTELAKILFGAEIPDTGEILFLGQKQHLKHPKDAIKAGLGFCTEDRKTEGIIPHLSVKENITLALLPQLCRFGVVSKKKQDEIVNNFIERLRIKTPSPNQLIRNLSGGNQQKVVIARWLGTGADVYIFDEPTRGIDVGARDEIYDIMLEIVKNGASIILISSDLVEIMKMCDEILIMREGCVAAVVSNTEGLTQKDVLSYALRGGQANGRTHKN